MKKLKLFWKIVSIPGMALIPVAFVASCENSKQKEINRDTKSGQKG
ncbi:MULTISPECIES: hypothetical protein [unclassified Mycoplasma]|nr:MULTISPECIES: hypothetical protein [unclassified Mycoplasma]MEA4206101.1 hypothetical protein [Mycoplasma sp. 1199]MEA4276149.1 hypothetical protein [Mycoplasma sp. 21DD0573]